MRTYEASMRKRATPLPPALARAPLGILRPRDAADTYAAPRAEFARLADAGVLHRLARGYFVIVPRTQIGRVWLPELEPAAAGVGASTFGPDHAILMGVSAARVHGAIPRALASAVVATPRQHRPIVLLDRPAVITFVKRDTDSLDAELIETSLGAVLVTTPEQTLLDLVRRPGLGDAEVDALEAATTLYRSSDRGRLTQLAREQRLGAALGRVEKLMGEHG